jgi:M6 family metalloprotease-like protein
MLVVALVALALPASIRAQDAPPVRREIRGFDFRKDGVWRRQARSVRAQRARLLARRNFGALNAPMATAGGGGGPLSAGAPLAGAAAVSGVLRVPAVLFKFKNTPTTELRNTTQYNEVLFAPAPTGASAGRPYTYTSWYAQLSNGLLSIQGASYGYAALDSNEVTYTGASGTCSGSPVGGSDCNGLFSADAFTRMQNGLRLALKKIDAQVDWTQYDSDGDGYVDLVAFIHPALDGACGPVGNNHLWSHRSYLANLVGDVFPYTTHSVNSSGVHIKVADYILESGVGGESGCDSTQIMPIGTVAHETGHGLGLPDLYDVNYLTAGIGRYSLMGFGPYFSGVSPARLDAWSLSQLGWVTVVPLRNAGTSSFGPAPTSDTAFYLPVFGPNPRGEYFLLENREGVQSDTPMIRRNCQVWYQSATPPANCGGGLLVYHVDSQQIAQHGFGVDNTVNSGPIHGVAVVQADGRGNLDATPNNCNPLPSPPPAGCADYGDAGDVFPGTTNNLAYTPSSVPAAVRNGDGKAAGFFIAQVFQPAVNGAVQFQLTYPDWVVRATDSAAVIKFDGAPYHVFRSILDSGTVHTVAVDSVQFTASGRTRQEFRSWSNGKALSHTDTAGAVPDTIVATLARFHQLVDTATSGGTVTADTAAVPVASGSFFAAGTSVRLTATDTSSATVFLSWAGDTVTKTNPITVPMGRPYTVRAVFLAPLNAADVVAQLLNGTGPLTTQQLQDLDQLGNTNGRFDVGDFLAWARATGAALTPAQRALIGAVRLKSKAVSR